VNKILELGTYDGECAHIASKLFPHAEIVTVDLPKADPLARQFYGREKDEVYNQFLAQRRQHLASKNISVIEANTLFLMNHVSGPFDVIWVDAWHLYPEVAWDIAYAYHLCRPGGWLMVDDVIPEKRYFKDDYVSTESFEVIEYLTDRIKSEPVYFLKRRLPEFCRSWVDRKYVACLRKPGSVHENRH
jgi:predicted O-methyltransferase YrrM